MMFSRCFVIVLSFLTIACNPDKEGRRLPRHSGEPGEVIVVMDEGLWLGAAGDSLRVIMEEYVQFIPQAEPRFKLLHFTQAEMSGLLQQHRNIVQINIGPDFTESEGVKLIRDKWSNHQVVIAFNAADMEAYYSLLDEQFSKAADIIDQTEFDRLDKRLYKFKNDEIQTKIRNDFGIDLRVPDDCEIAKEGDDFLWIKRERIKYIRNEGHQITQGFFVYKYPYSSDSAFTQDEILAVRDSVLKKYVPGPSANSYMTTEYRYPPESENMSINGRFATITRGLWRTENEFMGGPFVSLTTTNAEGDEIICVSGFVFAPKFDKREYIREVEAVLRTVKPLTQAD
jgi:hypothetical protein